MSKIEELISGMRKVGEQLVRKKAREFAYKKAPDDIDDLFDEAETIGALTGLGREETVPRALIQGGNDANTDQQVRVLRIKPGSGQQKSE